MDHRETTFVTRLRLWTAALAVVCCSCQDEETVEPPEPGQSAGALSGSEVLRYTTQPPSPNGSYDFPYTASLTYPIQNLVFGSAPSSSQDLSASFETLWDAQNLYVFVHISDENTWRRPDNFPWENDSIEIYIDGDHSAGTSYDGVNDFQLVLTAIQPGAVVAGVRSAPYAGGITYYDIFPFRGDGTYYQVRVTIPWSTLHVTPQVGREIGLDVHVNDNDDGSEHRVRKLAAFANVDDSWTNPSSFKTFVLGPVQPLPPHVENGGGIVADGVARPGEWDHADEYPIENLLLGSRAPGFAASYRAAWNPYDLALFVRVRDAQIVRDSAYPWEDDSVEIFLDPGPSGAYGAVARQYVFRPGDPTVYFGSRTPNPENAGTISVATQLVPGGYDMEITVPWSRFNLGGGPIYYFPYTSPLITPNALGIDVQVNDDRDGGNRDGKIAKFATVDDAWDNPGRFGRVPLIWRPAI